MEWPNRFWPIITSYDKRTRAWYWTNVLAGHGSGGPCQSEADALKEAQAAARTAARDNEE